ncbi:ABC transporter substrate-binding protein [Teichococcus oryzae]|uniref:ABC transporter substrate-binding protein n=1 Tax=Teichococcus oryzae TaxID=1608942 RepID=A0A5B2TJW2_9PROT|nr:ABC transporter substrate-binding protein [Pseudoroseomonas oryzae]KAA2214762.1 ABC transporter substrate-binding protein [Pseudoroseomonas oryzae]
MPAPSLNRRASLGALLGAAGALATPRLGHGQAARSLRFVPQADLTILDPVWTPGIVTRNHGLMVFDTLYGVDTDLRPQPQMAAGHEVEDGGRRWTITLRPGLRFHDGEPVRARDAVASIRRWGQRDTFGIALMAMCDEIAAPDDARLVFRLKRPFAMLPDALGKPGTMNAFIMPERLALTDPGTQVTEMVGSGPYRFLADEHVVGARTAYRRFEGYLPRQSGTPSLLAGPKVAHFERVEWVSLPDPATAAAALQQGEVDWWEQPPADLAEALRRNRNIRQEVLDTAGSPAFLRFNQLYPPFDRPAMRRALLGTISQADFMQTVAGTDRALWRDDLGYFLPGTPMASDEGMSALTGPRDLDAVKRALAEAGYRGERIIHLQPTDYPSVSALNLVAADVMRRCGMNVELQAMDFGSFIRRIANQEAPERGGWNSVCVSTAGASWVNPAAHNYLRGNGRRSIVGWPTSERLEALRDRWFDTPPEGQAALGREMQAAAFEDVPFIPVGLFHQNTAYRSDLSGMVKGAPVFWNIRRG